MKIIKIIGVFLCVVAIPFVAQFTWFLIYSATSVTCLESKPEDTFVFGKALAINDNYIAVGDPKANRVAIYSHDESKDKWSRIREIYPPKNSVIDRVGYGFGNSLVLNQNQLIIGAYSQPKLETIGNEPATEESKLAKEYHGAVYSLLLDKNERNFPQEIALPDSFKLTGYSVTIFNSKLALGATTEAEPYIEPGKVLIIDPTTLEVEKIIEPPSLERKFADFGFVIDGNNNFLLIGSRGLTQKGGALLIDKAEKIEEISFNENLATPLSKAGSFVALTDNFVAIGTSSSWGSESTLLLKPFAEGWSLADIFPFGGFIDVTESYVLISSGKNYGMPTGIFYRTVNTLMRIDKNQQKIKSRIHWKIGSDSRYESKGLIYSDYLVLSHKGKVVLLSIKHLPSSYLINQSFCRKK